MNIQDAYRILDQALSSINTNRQVHATLTNALNYLTEQAYKSETKKEKVDMKPELSLGKVIENGK